MCQKVRKLIHSSSSFFESPLPDMEEKTFDRARSLLMFTGFLSSFFSRSTLRPLPFDSQSILHNLPFLNPQVFLSCSVIRLKVPYDVQKFILDRVIRVDVLVYVVTLHLSHPKFNSFSLLD